MTQVRAITKSERCVIMLFLIPAGIFNELPKASTAEYRVLRIWRKASRAGLGLLSLGGRVLRSKVDMVREFAEAVIPMLDGVIAHNDDSESRFVTALRHANRPGGYGFNVAV